MNDTENLNLKHKVAKYYDEFTKLASKSFKVVTEQGFRTFLLLATEKIKRQEFTVLNRSSSNILPSGSNSLHEFVTYLAQRFGCTHVIDVTCRSASNLADLYSGLQVIGINIGKMLRLGHELREYEASIECSLDDLPNIPISYDMIKRSAIVCTGVIEYLGNPTYFLENLKRWLNYAPVCILSIPQRDLIHRNHETNSSANTGVARKWNPTELETLLRTQGFNLAFIGLNANIGTDFETNEIIAVIEKNIQSNNGLAAPRYRNHISDFRVVTIMPAYNEEDIIVPSIKHLVDQGIGVYLIDNWSTDTTYDLAKQFIKKGLVGIERFPRDGPSRYFDFRGILRRIEQVSRTIEADWLVYQDVDEVRMSPWAGMSYKEGIYEVDRTGFNSIDHTTIMFNPVDNNYVPASDFEAYFKYFEFAKRQLPQIKAWKNLRHHISLVASGGHQVRFGGRKVYPYNFLIKHYRIRSQQHGEKKVFLERKSRWMPEESARGWHIQYDNVKEGQSFLRLASDLEFFDEVSFNKMYLIERLSGIGAARKTFRTAC